MGVGFDYRAGFAPGVTARFGGTHQRFMGDCHKKTPFTARKRLGYGLSSTFSHNEKKLDCVKFLYQKFATPFPYGNAIVRII
jgi:hypothetical protein